MVTVWRVRNSASPQELQSQEWGGKKAGLERGRQASIAIHQACASPAPTGLAHSESAHVTTTWVCGTSGRAEVFFTLVGAVGTRAGQVGQQVKELA